MLNLEICLCKIQEKNYYHPQMKFAKAMFLPVCHSVHRGVSRPRPKGVSQPRHGSFCLGDPGPGPLGCQAGGVQTQSLGCLPRGCVQMCPCPGPGVCVSQHALRQTALQQTATAADGMHPTGMHSSYYYYYIKCLKEIT